VYFPLLCRDVDASVTGVQTECPTSDPYAEEVEGRGSTEVDEERSGSLSKDRCAPGCTDP
jgi:hypothetical protein